MHSPTTIAFVVNPAVLASLRHRTAYIQTYIRVYIYREAKVWLVPSVFICYQPAVAYFSFKDLSEMFTFCCYSYFFLFFHNLFALFYGFMAHAIFAIIFC